jgi:hypothetical protein
MLESRKYQCTWHDRRHTKKDEYLFITAHYDHLGQRGDTTIYYGADDDGSGTVSVIEIAEAFMKAKQAGKGPARTIVFMTVSVKKKDYGVQHSMVTTRCFH